MSDCKQDKTTGKLEAPRRNNYFYGKLLDEKSLTMEQRYFNRKRWMMNRLGLGSGVLCGLNVTVQDKNICISSGVAIDGLGREMVVPSAILIDPRQLTDDAGRPTTEKLKGDGQVFLTLCYCECPADYVPVLVTDCDSTNQTKPSTITEGYCLIVKECTEDLPPALPPVTDPAICAALSEVDAKTKRKKICEVLSKRPCPALGECIVLAKIILKEDKVEVELCGARPLVYSNPELFEMLMCLSTGDGTSTPGPMGPAGLGIDKATAKLILDCKADPSATIDDTTEPGKRILVLGVPRGCDGADGPPGPGLEPNLTRIVALSWGHEDVYGTNKSPLVPVQLRTSSTGKPIPIGNCLVIGFSDDVTPPFPPFGPNNNQFPNLNSLPALEVMVPDAVPNNALLYSWASILGFVVPVTSFTTNANGRIAGAEIVMTGTTLPSNGLGIAFLPLDQGKIMPSHRLVLVRLRGDFFLDSAGKAIDAEFVRGELPTGDRPAGSKVGIQGGMFESWFTYTADTVPDTGASHLFSNGRVRLNSASVIELGMVPSIGFENAAAIVTVREQKTSKQFKNFNELVGIGTIDKTMVDLIRAQVQLK